MYNSHPYTTLSAVYDHLMSEIDYELWAEYIHSIIDPFVDPDDLVLEIASGSGTFGKFFHRHFKKLILSDLSHSMLSQVKNANYPRVCCDMRNLPFASESVGVIVCLFDSVNYLLTQKDLSTFFESAHRVLHNNGILVFDACMFNGSKKHAKLKKRNKKFNGVVYNQVSQFNELNGTHKNIFEFILPDGRKVTEIHKQKIYSFQTIIQKVMAAGFTVLDCYQDFTYKEATTKSDRIHFVVRK